MMLLTERVRPRDPKKRVAANRTLQTDIAAAVGGGGLNNTRLGARNARNTMASSSSPRQLHHRVVRAPVVVLSPESSSVCSVSIVGRSSTHATSRRTGNEHLLFHLYEFFLSCVSIPYACRTRYCFTNSVCLSVVCSSVSLSSDITVLKRMHTSSHSLTIR